MAAARHRVYNNIGWNVEADGLIDAPPVTVVIGDEAHPTLIKSLGLLGLGRDRVVRVPVDGQGRMRANKLPDINGPTIVCTQVGNVNTGAFNPIGDICAEVRPQGAWVHVEGERMTLEGTTGARLFLKGDSPREIETGACPSSTPSATKRFTV